MLNGALSTCGDADVFSSLSNGGFTSIESSRVNTGSSCNNSVEGSRASTSSIWSLAPPHTTTPYYHGVYYQHPALQLGVEPLEPSLDHQINLVTIVTTITTSNTTSPTVDIFTMLIYLSSCRVFKSNNFRKGCP